MQHEVNLWISVSKESGLPFPKQMHACSNDLERSTHWIQLKRMSIYLPSSPGNPPSPGGPGSPVFPFWEMIAISPSSPGGPLAPSDIKYAREEQTEAPHM